MDTSFLHRHPKIEEACTAKLQGHVVIDANEWKTARKMFANPTDFVQITGQISDKLVEKQIHAEQMSHRNEFAEKYHNGRADGFVESRDIVESILLAKKTDK